MDTTHTQTDRDTIEKVQKRAARWINARWDNSTKKWSRSYDESLTELHWSTIEQRHSYLSLCQVYKIINRLDCINFTDYFSPCKAPQTRYCKVNSLQCMPSRVNAFRYSFFISAPFIWNSLPVHISSAPTYAAFKSSLLSFRFVP